jgi:hypothetical protein
MSTETGEDTDFVILMSGEPQGGITMRRHDPDAHCACRLMRPHLIVLVNLPHGSRAGGQTAPGGVIEGPASPESRMYSRVSRTV